MSTSVDEAAVQNATKADDSRYRPKASTARVHAQIESALREIVSEAATQLSNFMHLSWADEKAGTAVVYGHVVDASECLEIAATHLLMLKTAVAYRLRIEDDKNGADLPF